MTPNRALQRTCAPPVRSESWETSDADRSLHRFARRTSLSLGRYVFHQPLGFGVEFASVRDAYDQLSVEDGWLILLRDASAGSPYKRCM